MDSPIDPPYLIVHGCCRSIRSDQRDTPRLIVHGCSRSTTSDQITSDLVNLPRPAVHDCCSDTSRLASIPRPRTGREKSRQRYHRERYSTNPPVQVRGPHRCEYVQTGGIPQAFLSKRWKPASLPPSPPSHPPLLLPSVFSLKRDANSVQE